MGAVLGLGRRRRAGAGLAGADLAAARRGRPRSGPGRTRDLLDRAGLAGTTVAGVWTVCACRGARRVRRDPGASRARRPSPGVRRCWPGTSRSRCWPAGPGAGSASSPRSGRRRSTTSPRAVRAGMSLPEALTAARAPRARAAARAVPGVRRRLPGDRPVRREPRPAQGAARRPGRRPGRRGAADRPRGRRRRAGQPAAQPVRLPARGRAHPLRAGVAPGLDRQRRPAGGRRAVARAAAAVLPARGDRPLRLARPASWCWPSVRGCASSPTARWSGSGGCPTSGGCCREPDDVGSAARGGCRPRPGAGGDPACSRCDVRCSACGCCPTSATCPQSSRAGRRHGPRPARSGRVFGPLLGSAADSLERVLGGNASIRRRLERAGLDHDGPRLPRRAGAVGTRRLRASRRRSRCWSPLRAPGADGAAAGALRGRRSCSACCCGRTG